MARPASWAPPRPLTTTALLQARHVATLVLGRPTSSPVCAVDEAVRRPARAHSIQPWPWPSPASAAKAHAGPAHPRTPAPDPKNHRTTEVIHPPPPPSNQRPHTPASSNRPAKPSQTSSSSTTSIIALSPSEHASQPTTCAWRLPLPACIQATRRRTALWVQSSPPPPWLDTTRYIDRLSGLICRRVCELVPPRSPEGDCVQPGRPTRHAAARRAIDSQHAGARRSTAPLLELAAGAPPTLLADRCWQLLTLPCAFQRRGSKMARGRSQRRAGGPQHGWDMLSSPSPTPSNASPIAYAHVEGRLMQSTPGVSLVDACKLIEKPLLAGAGADSTCTTGPDQNLQVRIRRLSGI